MSLYHIPPPDIASVPVVGSDRMFPVRRIFCVGRNYAEHAREMGGEVDREAPFYFTKSAEHLVAGDGSIPYPPGTGDYHHEVELVVAIGAEASHVAASSAQQVVFGHAVGLDMTRRDLQAAAKEKRRPWDIGKDVEASAVIGPITPAGVFDPAGESRLTLRVNGAVRQDCRLGDMVWGIDELIEHLSTLYRLLPGDLIFTGTPAGVGAVHPGDRLDARCEGLEPLLVTIGPTA
jgi:fumarylpyruvate hydrolase